MDNNSTFEAMETKAKEALERYRFIFLRYLEVAKTLIELKKEAERVLIMQEVLTLGWSFDTPALDYIEDQAVKAGNALYNRYDLIYSQEGFERAINQFHADLSVTEEQEESLWQALVKAVNQVDPQAAGSNYGRCVDAETHRAHIISAAPLALERIEHYQKELRNLSKPPAPPYVQETIFCSHYGRLADIAPFSLR